MSNKNDKMYIVLRTAVMLVILCSAPSTVAAFTLTAEKAPAIEQFILAETNSEREIAGSNPLQLNTALTAIAHEKANQLARRGEFAHQLSDGTMVWSLFPKHKYRYRHAGENLALHFRDGNDLMNAWLHSPTHRENLLTHKYTEMGVGVAVGKFGGKRSLVVVHIFGSQFE